VEVITSALLTAPPNAVATMVVVEPVLIIALTPRKHVIAIAAFVKAIVPRIAQVANAALPVVTDRVASVGLRRFVMRQQAYAPQNALRIARDWNAVTTVAGDRVVIARLKKFVRYQLVPALKKAALRFALTRNVVMTVVMEFVLPGVKIQKSVMLTAYA
jgi:hypothetical protein